MKKNIEKIVMIVGACCSFGTTLCDEVLKRYDGVFLTETTSKRYQVFQLSKLLSEKYPDKKVYSSLMDVKRLDEIGRVINEIDEKKIKVYKLIYCAGINVICDALTVTEEVWDEVLSVNLKGFFFVAQAVIAHMIREDIKGSILAVASQHAVVANYSRAPYCASKAGLINLVRELALEFAGENINVNAVSPSFIKNKMNEQMLNSNRCKEKYLNEIPMKRYAVSNDVVYAILYLISDNAEFITGTNLLIDGGYTIK